MFLYLYEVNQTVQAGQRVFDIYLNNELQQSRFDVSGNGSNYKELAFTVTANGFLNLTLVKAPGSENGPLCNAYEILQVLPWVQETNQSDGKFCLPLEFLVSNWVFIIISGFSSLHYFFCLMTHYFFSGSDFGGEE